MNNDQTSECLVMQTDWAPILIFDVGKRWARGYTQKRRDIFLSNIGTENGLKRFDWRTFFYNLYNSDGWYRYNQNLYTLEQRQDMSRRFVETRKELGI